MWARARTLALIIALVATGLNATPTQAIALGARAHDSVPGATAQSGSPALAGEWHLDTTNPSGDHVVTPDSSGNQLDARVVAINQPLVAGRFGDALDLAAATAGVVATHDHVGRFTVPARGCSSRRR